MKLNLLLMLSQYRYKLNKLAANQEVIQINHYQQNIIFTTKHSKISLQITTAPLKSQDYLLSSDQAGIIINHLQQVLVDYLNWCEQLSQSLSFKHPVNRALLVLKQKIANPIMVFDGSFKLLAYNAISIDWKSSIKRGYISIGSSQTLQQIINTGSATSGQVITATHLQNPFYLHQVALRNDDRFFLIIVKQNKDTFKQDITLVESVIDKISATVGLHNFPYLTQNANLEDVLRDLLSRPQITHTELQNRLQFDPHQLKRPLAVLCIPSTKLHDQVFGTILTKFVSFHYDQYNVYIVENYSSVILQTIKQELNDFLIHNKLVAGLSNPFIKLHHFNQFYQQAVKAVHFCPQSEHFTQYQDHIAEDLIQHIKEDHSISSYLSPTVKKLKKQDSKLFHTLKVYFEFQSNKKLTAAYLKIHRSTLDYRLDKIKTKYQLAFDIPNQYLYIFLSVLLMS